MRLALLSSGGDSPGMNAAIRAVVRQADALGIGILGVRRGFEGLVEGDWRELRSRDCANILQRGGTILHTARCQSWFDPAVRAKAHRALRTEGIEGLVVIGGDGSFRGAQALWEAHGLPCAGIPGTIDNDLPGTDLTLGFDTALNTAVEAIDRIRDTASSHERLFLVEVMGRHSGMIAVHTALACGAEAVLYPESEADTYQALITSLQASWARGKKASIVVVAEGDQSGSAYAVGERLRKEHALDLRVVVLGHIQRGGSPSAMDRIWGSRWGAEAVRRLAAGGGAFYLGRLNGDLVAQPMEALLGPPPVPPPFLGELVPILSR